VPEDTRTGSCVLVVVQFEGAGKPPNAQVVGDRWGKVVNQAPDNSGLTLPEAVRHFVCWALY
jgi:hypothetical protein